MRRRLSGRPSQNTLGSLRAAIDDFTADNAGRPRIIGLAGAQGSGKSTLAKALTRQLIAEKRKAACVSLDDFYLSRMERRRLAANVHPLFVTRGPPGTHLVEEAIALIAAVKSGAETFAPRFDKAQDEPAPLDSRTYIPAGLDIFIIEGWCLGARPQPEAALAEPINMLERVFDPDAVWRRAVNDALGGAYQSLFAEIDHLVYLRAPSFEVVRRWRTEQEDTLAATSPKDRPGIMSPDEISFFVQHYERITRWMMEDMQGRAKTTFRLDERRAVEGIISPEDFY